MDDATQKKCDELIKKTSALFGGRKYAELVDVYKSIIKFKSVARSTVETNKNCEPAENDEYKYHANISHVYHVLCDYANALSSAEACIELCPKWYKGYYRAAKASEGLLAPEKAREYYSKMSTYAASCNLQKKEQDDLHNVDVNILREWLQSNGANLGSTKIEYYDVDYRGMYVDRSVKVNENIMKIPAYCIMSLEESKMHGTNGKLLSLGAQYNSPHTHLAIQLLDAKYDAASRYKYYIQCLPKYFDNVPINFNKEKLQNLEGSFALVKIAQKCFYLKAEYAHILSLMPDFKYTYDDFVWARTCVITRVYAVDRIIGGKPVKDTVLVPFADMANHVMVPNTHWFFDQSIDSFVVNAAKHLHSGDNLFESYGKKNNYRYFVNYGFTVENNAYDEVAIVLNPILHKLIAEKSYFINEKIVNYINSSREMFQIGYDKTSEQFQNMLKFSTLKSAELLGLDKNQAPMDQVYGFILGFMEMTLSGFDTSLEEDLQMLKTYDMGFDIRNCLIQRIGEKKLLRHYIGYFKDLIRLDACPAAEKKKLIKKIEKKYAVPA